MDFPGSPVVKILCFHYRQCEFNPWLKIPHVAWPQVPQKKKATQRKPSPGYFYSSVIKTIV